VLEPFQYLFVQRGLLEIALLSVGAGLLGPWLVMRGLAFYAHAVGTAAFPGLVVADGLAFSPPLGAALAAATFALGVGGLGRARRVDYASLTALALVGSLAAGVILASDVFHSGTNVDTLLFGSLLLIGTRELVLAALVSALALVATVALGRVWLVRGFDDAAAPALGARSGVPDLFLLGLVAFAAVASLAALGALLVSALLVVPAATTRLWTRRIFTWQLASIALVALEGCAGLWLSVELNVPPGAAIAILTGSVFAVAAAARRVAPARLGAAVTLGTVLLVAAGCGVASGGSNGKPTVVATTTQLGDWARAVGGDAVSVHQILRPNTDPHEYEPRPADVVRTAGAAVVFESGEGLDDWMDKVVSEGGGHPKVVVLARSVVDGHDNDPHWWHDPVNAEAAVKTIRAALAAAEPSRKRLFQERAGRYLERLRRLDAGIRACVDRVPPAERKLVTDHDAFGYFAGRYGIRIVGAVIPSQSTQAQPSAGETARLIRLVRREHVRAVFPESSLSPRLADAVARATGASSDSTLYGDTLGPAGSSGSTYLRMEAANASAMVRGFTGGKVRCRIRVA